MTGATASGQHLTTDRWLAIGLGFVLTAAMWWLYFDEVAQRSVADFEAAEDQRGQLGQLGQLGRDAYTYLHIPIVAGIIIAAVALELVIAHPIGVAEIAVGRWSGHQLTLRSTSLRTTPTAKQVTLLERDFELAGDALRYELRMSTDAGPASWHLSGELRRTA